MAWKKESIPLFWFFPTNSDKFVTFHWLRFSLFSLLPPVETCSSHAFNIQTKDPADFSIDFHAKHVSLEAEASAGLR